jgi:hypothetical protein
MSKEDITFPSKITKSGNRYYINIPKNFIQHNWINPEKTYVVKLSEQIEFKEFNKKCIVIKTEGEVPLDTRLINEFLQIPDEKYIDGENGKILTIDLNEYKKLKKR